MPRCSWLPCMRLGATVLLPLSPSPTWHQAPSLQASLWYWQENPWEDVFDFFFYGKSIILSTLQKYSALIHKMWEVEGKHERTRLSPNPVYVCRSVQRVWNTFCVEDYNNLLIDTIMNMRYREIVFICKVEYCECYREITGAFCTGISSSERCGTNVRQAHWASDCDRHHIHSLCLCSS